MKLIDSLRDRASSHLPLLPVLGSGGKDEVVELTESNFKKLVLGSEDMWLVEFFAPWCGHCKNLAPHWSKAAKELKGKVKLGAVDATVHQSLAQQYGVQGYPTIKYFPQGIKSGPEEYNGGRSRKVHYTHTCLLYTSPSPRD